MKKLMSLLLAVVMLLGCMPAPLNATAAENSQKLYLKPNDNWLQANARFAIYYWDANGSAWTDMADTNNDGYYEGEVPAGITNVIFCRMNPGAAANDWNNKWNQTSDLTVPTDGTNCYTVTGDSWDHGSGEWSTYTPEENPGAPGESDPVEVLYYVAGVDALCGSNWANNDPANQMTLDTDGLYKKTFEKIPAGTYEFKVTDGTWDNCWPGSNYVFTTTEEKNVTVTFNADTKEVGVVLTDAVTVLPFYVAGTADLCGSEWANNDPANKMALNGEGLYEKTYFSVPAGDHAFKITDGTWTNSWGQDGGEANYKLELLTESNVTITFNPETKEITVTLTAVEPYYVAGTEDLCGEGWEPGYAANKMLLDTDGLYKKTFRSVPAGEHKFKITDGTWSNCWGRGDDGDGNTVFTTDEVKDVTITFNAETKEIDIILSDATDPGPITPPEPVEYDITIKVHYYRPDAAYGEWEVHMWNGAAGLSATRKFELEDVTYNGTTYGATATYYADASDTWVGYIIKKPDWTKDPDGDRKIDISNVLSGTVHVYAKTGSSLNDFITDKSEAVLGNKLTAAVYDRITGKLTFTTAMAVEGDLNTAFTLEGPDGEVTITKVTRIGSTNNYAVEYEGQIDPEQVYTAYFNGMPCEVTVPNVYSTEAFEAEYTYTGDDLGAAWSPERTTFRVWAPTASAVSVNLYATGSDDEQGAAELGAYAMTQDVNGTWIVTIQGDLRNVYYTYSVTRKGETVEACDPYARATGVNGDRAMVIDLDSTDPAGWDDDDYVTQSSYTDAVIWELHVRDFSIDESSGMVNKGKYLAFTERGTTVPGTDISTGVDYMTQLGVNYVHLLPVYDINSVDETTGGYNWGYDPKNYNVPEGSYSTDPYDGTVRVNEFKQMVQSLHDAGIGVVMDVVYNHVADGDGFCFNQIVPGYFSRIHDDGSYQSDSGCGNDTASERAMVRKYIVDSVLYWAEEYHIDGFRWDLVGLIDYETINEVMAEVHAVNPDIIFYGEGWEMCGWTTKDEGVYASDPYSKKMTIQNNDKLVNTDAGVFAFFNDTMRNVIHGGVFNATDKGFVSGNMNAGTKQTIIDGYMAYSVWGSAGQRVDTPWQTINYASCHDNHTLFDNLTVDVMDATGASAADAAAKAAEMNNLAAAYYITAQGVPFIHAGEEMLRSKPDASSETGFNHNSYAAGDEINAIKWYTLSRPLVADTLDYYTGLIAFRKAHPALRMNTQAEILAAMTALQTASNDLVVILNKGGNGEKAEILTILNASGNAAEYTLPEGEWEVYVNKAEAGTEVLDTVSGTIRVESTSAMILVKAEQKDYTITWKQAFASLGGNIAVVFQAELSDGLAADSAAFVRFTYAGKTVDIPVCDAVKSGDYYNFYCRIASVNMIDEITAQMMVGEETVGKSVTTSLEKYCSYILSVSKDEKTVNLMKAMLNYGAAAQSMIGYKTDDLANKSLSEADKVLTAVDASAYAHSISGTEDGIKPVEALLVLNAETTIRVGFQLTGDKSIEEYTFTVDGVEVEPVYKGGKYVLEVSNIAAHRLDEYHTFTCGNITVTYCGLSYVNQVMGYYTEGTTFDMAVALYNYSQATEAYAG